MKASRFAYVNGLARLTVILGCLSCARPSGTLGVERPSPPVAASASVRTSQQEQDSVQIVQLAIRALLAGRETLPLVVARFIRDEEGTLVRLIGNPEVIEGGGGLVWVDSDGFTVVVRRYQ